jgi:serine palmitoyltransferase
MIWTACDQVGEILQLKFSSGISGGAEPEPEQPVAERIGRLTHDEMATSSKRRKKYRRGKSVPLKAPRWKLDDVIRMGEEDVKMPLR